MSDIGQSFLSLDPLAMEFSGWSDYNYVLGNPINLIDEDGKAPQDPPMSTELAKSKMRWHTITISSEINELWDRSFIDGGREVEEWGAMIRIPHDNDKFGRTKLENVATDHDGLSVTIYQGDLTDKPIGSVHTHPFSIEEGSHLGVPFSSLDIATIYGHAHQSRGSIPIENGTFTMVEAGTKRFSIMVVDGKKAKTFFKNMNFKKILETYEKAFNNTKGTLAERQLKSSWEFKRFRAFVYGDNRQRKN